jgi:hypothetical protein
MKPLVCGSQPAETQPMNHPMYLNTLCLSPRPKKLLLWIFFLLVIKPEHLILQAKDVKPICQSTFLESEQETPKYKRKGDSLVMLYVIYVYMFGGRERDREAP